MKTTVMALCLLAASSSVVSAQFRPSKESAFNGGYLECGIVELKDVDRHKESNPVYKINIRLDLNDSGNPTAMTVTHVAVDGSFYNRHEQYTVNSELTSTKGKMEWFWSGTLTRNTAFRMKGALIKNSSGWHYYETLTRNGKVEMLMHAICHIQQME